jgi:hypothetical protein
VQLDRPPEPEALDTWRTGTLISSPSSSGSKMLAHTTMPCAVRELSGGPITKALRDVASEICASAAARAAQQVEARAAAQGWPEEKKLRHLQMMKVKSAKIADASSHSASSNSEAWVEFTLHEGRNRQIRKMAHALGYTVRALLRPMFCGVGMKGLKKPGDWAYLTEDEMLLLRSRK